jgi:hypothetical protein
MERKGKFPFLSLACSAFTWVHGRARRRSWTISLGCLVSTSNMVWWSRRKRRSRPITSPCTTPGRPRAHIRTMVLLCHTTQAPPHGRVGRVGIDLHLGQKPKLGGRYADDSLIYILYFVGPLYIHVSLSLLFSFLFPPFQNTKRPKIFLLFLFVYLFSLLPLVCFTCYFRFAIWKIQKYFALFAISFCFCFKNRKPQKYLLFFFGFVKFVAEFSLPLLHWSLVFTLYYSSHISEEQ